MGADFGHLEDSFFKMILNHACKYKTNILYFSGKLTFVYAIVVRNKDVGTIDLQVTYDADFSTAIHTR